MLLTSPTGKHPLVPIGTDSRLKAVSALHHDERGNAEGPVVILLRTQIPSTPYSF